MSKPELAFACDGPGGQLRLRSLAIRVHVRACDWKDGGLKTRELGRDLQRNAWTAFALEGYAASSCRDLDLELYAGTAMFDSGPRHHRYCHGLPSAYNFVKEDMNGTSPKFYARDNYGVKWLVKLGVEARPETAATRLVWAMGYFTDEDYFLPQIHVRNLPKLRRKMFGASPETGIVPSVRLKRQGEALKKVENWNWFDNPFVGPRELNGLRALMAVINDWDLTTENNKVYVGDNERHYLVSDLGAAVGKTGWPPSQVPLFPHATKGVLKDYEHSRFIRAVTGDAVTFEMHTTAPFFISRFKRKYSNEYRQAERLEQGIPVLDTEWIGGLLVRLTPQQIRDAFRAAGYQPT